MKKTYDIVLEGVYLHWQGAIFFVAIGQAKSPSLAYRFCFLAWITFTGMKMWHKEKSHNPYWQSICGHCAGTDAWDSEFLCRPGEAPSHRLSGGTGTLYGFKCSLIECGKSSSQPSLNRVFIVWRPGGEGEGRGQGSTQLCPALLSGRYTFKRPGRTPLGQRKIPMRHHIIRV